MSHPSVRFLTRALIAMALVPCWGCGASGSGASAPLVSVKGKVTYKGRPLTSGVVRFQRDGYGRAATGRLQSDGSYTLGTNKEGDGVIAGEHQVTIGGFDKPLANDRTLKKYGIARSSELKAEVDAEHTEFNFDLK
jgi:hypothetical protein